MEKEHKWHGSHHYSDKLHLVFVVFLFLGIITLIFSYIILGSNRFNYRNSDNPAISVTPPLTPTPTQEEVFCTQEAKLCPDGTYVGRISPNCEFAPCPN